MKWQELYLVMIFHNVKQVDLSYLMDIIAP